MAVIPKGGSRNTQQSDATDSPESKGKGKVVDILQDKSLPSGAKMKLAVQDGKPTEDAWEFAAPPDEGKYELKILLGKDAVTEYPMDFDNPDWEDVYYSIAFECKLTDEQYAGITVFPKVTTRIGRGKNISTAAGFLWKLGYKVPEEVTHKDLARLIVQVVMKEPVLSAELGWRGWSKDDSKVAYPNQKAFPFDVETGKHDHIAQYKTKSGQIEEIRAQLQVLHWYGKKDGEGEGYKGKGGKPTVGVGGGKPQLMKPNLVEEPEEVVQITNKTNATQSESQDDLFAALEEA